MRDIQNALAENPDAGTVVCCMFDGAVIHVRAQHLNKLEGVINQVGLAWGISFTIEKMWARGGALFASRFTSGPCNFAQWHRRVGEYTAIVFGGATVYPDDRRYAHPFDVLSMGGARSNPNLLVILREHLAIA